MRILPCRTATLVPAICLLLVLNFSALVSATTLREAGITTGSTLLWMDETQLAYRMQDVRALGAKWIRVDFNWSTIQPDNYNDYEWGPYDRVVRAASRYHLKLLVTLAYTPRWARDPACASLVRSEESAQKCTPRSQVEFGRFARASVLRYKDQGVHTWEIWNEQNLTGYWKTVYPDESIFVDPAAYARAANAAAHEIRYNDAQAFIITGGLAPMFDPKHSRGMRQSDYLAQLLPNLKHNLFDAVGIHPYTWPKLPRLAADYNAFYTVDHGQPEYDLRGIMARAGWGDKQIWGTEFGASTKGMRRAGNTVSLKRGRPDHVSESMQARIIQQGVDDWYRKSNVGPIFVHTDSDQWLISRKNEDGFGLRRSDGTKKPAYDAFQISTQQL